MPPEIIQTQITAPLEEAVYTVKGVRKITSTSQIGLSRINLEFDPKTNMEFANIALKEEIAKARRRFSSSVPYDVRPTVVPYIPEAFQVQPFLRYTISGNYSLQKLREMVKDKLEFGLGSVQGVTSVSVRGGSDPEIRITLDKKKLKAYEIQPLQILWAPVSYTHLTLPTICSV